MSIYTHGTKVLIGGGSVDATVMSVCMAGPDYSHVTYLVEWWEDRTHKVEWLAASVVEAADESVSRITLSRASTP